MPDIDIDFCIEGREKVIEYVKDKYGHDKVCQIITFGTMMAKGVLKDVARVLSFPFEDANTLTGLIPTQLNITLEEAKEQEPQLKEMIANNPQVAKIFSIAERLEGLTRHASKHAAGIVISPEPIDEVLPVYIPAKTNDLVTQYAMTELETLGYLKMDFLGLKTLTLIDRTVKMIKENHKIEIIIDKLPLDDLKTFELLGEGLTSGVFQLESDGLKEVLRKLQPDKFEDIIAVNALYRPGPLGSGMVDDFVERRHGRQKVVYLLPELQPILEETYGVIVYQEQVMKIASVIGGYSLGEADILRRAMGKKKAEVMAEQSAIFVGKSKARNVDPKKAQELVNSGIKNIDDLRSRQNELLNDIQKVGLRYHEQIQERIPRSEIEEFEDIFKGIFANVAKGSPDAKFEIVGSYRRGAQTSGDIDVIITSLNHKVFVDFVDYLIKEGVCKSFNASLLLKSIGLPIGENL